MTEENNGTQDVDNAKGQGATGKVASVMAERDRNQDQTGRENSKRNGDGEGADVYLAALRATGPLAPAVAVGVTVFVYVLLYVVLRDVFPNFFPDESLISGVQTPPESKYAVAFGAFAVILGLVVALVIWLVFAFFYRPYTAANSANRRNYNLLREKLHRLRSRIKHARTDSSESQEEPANSTDRIIRNKACDIASRECNEIEKGLESSGMPWITGIGYIELWHRVHRAEEALIKVEPHTDALGGAMRDESRLIHSNIRNKDLLLKRLRCAVAMLDYSETGEYLNYLSESVKCPLSNEQRKSPENRAKALTILSEVRYEINHFRDNVWEGIINARNRLAETSVFLGFAAYSLLGLAIFVNVPHTAIVWAVAFFLVGALSGLFARSQAEWTADTAIDDFGLSTARLLHVPWLSGLAAVGGVLITSIADTLMTNRGGTFDLITIFDSEPATLLIVAAVFGLTPDLLIRRLTQQADKYKEDLQSTQSTQSIKSGPSTQAGQPG